MDKNAVIREESDNLGNVIKHLVDFDAQQRALISSAVTGREERRRELEAERSKINEEYMAQAQKELESLAESESIRAETEVKAVKSAARKNIAELDKTAAEKSEFWVEEIYRRTLSGE